MAVHAIQKEMVIPSESKYLSEVRDMVREMCQTRKLEERTCLLLSLAVDEAVTSMLTHANDTNRRGEIRVVVDLNETRFKATIEDHTNHLNVDPTNEAAYMAHLDRERRHQLAIFLMRKLLDEVNYSYKKGFQNDLHLVKFL